jgi:hypothetical protein
MPVVLPAVPRRADLNGENIRDVGRFAAKLEDREVEIVMLPTVEGG